MGNEAKATILIADDDAAIRASLALLLGRFGYKTIQADSPSSLLEKARIGGFDAVLLDMNFSNTTTGKEGLELLQKLQIFAPKAPAILITAWATIELAVEGMRLGAFDFIAKPWDNRVMLRTVETALELSKGSENQRETVSAKAGEQALPIEGIIGRDAALMRVLETVRQVSRTDASVLILGESGTGKELIAEAVHNLSPRAKKPFVKVNLGGISSTLFESEMFGHKRGAFTDAYSDRAGRLTAAEGGTLFLDEIGDLELQSQVKLLRVLQDRSYEVLGESKTRYADVRFVSATNADLFSKVQEGSFREDLLYRINLITLTLPPLRNRTGDIPLLAEHFLRQYAKDNNLPVAGFSPSAMDLLLAYSYPGNVRELKNAVERAAIFTKGDTVEHETMQRSLAQGMPTRTSSPETPTGTLDGVEAAMIRRALQRHGGNITRVAAELGITRAALYRRLEKHGIDHKRE